MRARGTIYAVDHYVRMSPYRVAQYIPPHAKNDVTRQLYKILFSHL